MGGERESEGRERERERGERARRGRERGTESAGGPDLAVGTDTGMVEARRLIARGDIARPTLETGTGRGSTDIKTAIALAPTLTGGRRRGRRTPESGSAPCRRSDGESTEERTGGGKTAGETRSESRARERGRSRPRRWAD
ncbi:hypothetical protein PHYPO_G00155430 [Pangasianodon hypophthalmus]|uniref:Uncharacterized protein n=1 Tax=Pangasianodon hypophthalmus TaxID=310915 RepID=A0A5N5K1T2_PANHP|nr:hypothetical protein PHYPO_G00155430 [Pangasianodon hypophthalmus]